MFKVKTIGRIFISSTLLDKLGLPRHPLIRIRAGNIVVNTELRIRMEKRKSYMLSPSLKKALYVKKRKTLRLRYDEQEDMLHLGPTVGIFSTSLPNRAEFDPRSIQAELQYMSSIGKTLPGQFYIFLPGAINWANNTCRGYNYRQLSPQRGVWVSSVYPIPDVVYDRIPTRSSEARENIKKIKKKLMALPYLKYFNPSFLNKWKVHEILRTNSELEPYLPETRQFSNYNMSEMLQKYKVLFFKPSNGSLGHGIIKIRSDENGVLHYIVYKNGRIRNRADNVEEFIKKTRVYHKNKPYIVQQGIKLQTYKGSSFDIRIIYQKNARGEWQIGKKFVRLAPKGSSISNISRGGRVERSKVVFRNLYKKRSLIERKNEEIRKLCNSVATTLEKKQAGTYGELGLDIGMDIYGNPWLIEVNSKPRKTTETDFSMKIVRNSFKRPLQYSSYLAGF